MQQQQPDNQRNLLLAIILSVAVLLAWQVFYAGPKLKEEQDRQKRVQQQSSQQVGANGAAKGGAAPSPVADGQAPRVPGAASGPGASRDLALKDSPRVTIDTPSLAGSVSLRGGRLDDLQLKRYRVAVDPKSPPVTLFSPASAPEPYFAEHGWTVAPGATAAVPGSDTLWRSEGAGRLSPETPLTLVWENGAGLTFKRTFSVDQNYLFKVVQEVVNTGSAPVTLYPYARIYRYGTPKIEGFYIQHEGLIGVSGDKGLNEITYSDAMKQGGGKSFDKVTGGWLGFTDKYWAATLIPDQSTVYRANYFSPNSKPADGARESFQADYLLSAVEVPAGGSRSITSHVFAGAKRVEQVERYQAELNILKYDLLIDWGWFYFITKPLFYLINWLYKLLGNFGLAILGVTVIVKAAFFWFANKSYESMAKMKKLQPEMEKIRERHKDDKARQQQELMALYSKEKINPLAGCLPILVQIPVFFALYKVLFISIDMRHAPFFGWIKDLSAADPTSLFNLFGLLPYAVPEFLHIGIWPIIMGVTMWVQMQLNPPQPDPIQQQIFSWMPVMFTFLLASFPAGLVIYWAWNNVLSLAQQWFIMKRQGVDVPLIDNLKRNLSAVGKLLGLANGKAKT